jgi:hypothetical protein
MIVFRNLKGTTAGNEFGHSPVRTTIDQIRHPLHGRNQGEHLKSMISIDGLLKKMGSDSGEVVHQSLGIFENIMIDSLQSVTIDLFPILAGNQKGIVYISITMRLIGGKRTISTETKADSFNGMIG